MGRANPTASGLQYEGSSSNFGICRRLVGNLYTKNMINSNFQKQTPILASRHSDCTLKLNCQIRCLHLSRNLLNKNIITIQDEDDYKKRVYNSEVPIVVDFTASWCGPCKILGPRLEAIVSSHDGKVLMAKVDIDDNAELAIENNVTAVPTVLGMNKGKLKFSFIGVKDEEELNDLVENLIGE